MIDKRISYSLPVLKTLLTSKYSCVYCFENCRRCFFTNPLQIGNIKHAVSEHLKSKVTSYDSELQGIILSHKNVKVVNCVQLSDEGEFSLDYIADIYIFKPTDGSILVGKANKKSQDHLGILVHSVFNATLPRPRFDEECPKTWAGANVKIGEEVTFKVVKVNLLSRLPYIKGTLISVKERDTEDGDSGIGGHESTEESPRNVISSFSSSDIDFEENLNDTKKRKKKKSSILNLQSSLLNEILGSPNSSHSKNKLKYTPVESESPSDEKSDMNLIKDRDLSTDRNIENSQDSKKSRKRKLSSLDIDNSLIKDALESVTSPKLSDQVTPKVKNKRNSDTKAYKSEKQEDDLKNYSFTESSSKQEVLESSQSVTSIESTITSLMTSQINSLTPERKSFSKGFNKKQETDSNELSLKNSFVTGEERKKKKSIDKEQIEQNIDNTNNISLSEESQRLLQLVEQGNFFTDTPHKKHKKKKSKESISLENTEKLDKVLNSSEDSIRNIKKKKKSVSFQDSVISSVIDSVFNVSREQSPVHHKKKNSISNVQQDNLDTTTNFLEPKNKKKVSCEKTDLINSELKSNQIQNYSGGIEEETCTIGDKKTKKKRKSSFLPETERSVLEISYSEFPNEEIQSYNGEQDNSICNKEHKNNNKKKSLSSQETQENVSIVNYTEENEQIQHNNRWGQDNSNNLNEHKNKKKKKSVSSQITEDNLSIKNYVEENEQIQNMNDEWGQDSSNNLNEHKKKKKKKSYKQEEENITDTTLSNQKESEVNFSEMPPPSKTKVKKRKFSEVEPLEVEADTLQEIIQVKKKKKKSGDIEVLT